MRDAFQCLKWSVNSAPLGWVVMRHRTLLVGVLGVALIASAYLVSRRGCVPPDRPEPSDSPAVLFPSAVEQTAPPPNGATAQLERAAREVRAMSQTFRNNTFLIAIRRAGYYCDDVASATESAEGAWVASCVNKGGYTLSVRAIDQFGVRPIGHYLDGVTPVPISPE